MGLRKRNWSAHLPDGQYWTRKVLIFAAVQGYVLLLSGTPIMLRLYFRRKGEALKSNIGALTGLSKDPIPLSELKRRVTDGEEVISAVAGKVVLDPRWKPVYIYR